MNLLNARAMFRKILMRRLYERSVLYLLNNPLLESEAGTVNGHRSTCLAEQQNTAHQLGQGRGTQKSGDGRKVLSIFLLAWKAGQTDTRT